METVVGGKAERRFKSPNRVLARFFRLARDKWKAKYKKLKEELKRMSNRVADARRSREEWANKARQLQAELERMKQAMTAQQQNEPVVASEEGEKRGALILPPSPTLPRSGMPLHMASMGIRLVLDGGLSLRSVPRVMMIVAECLRESTGQPLSLVPPDWTTIRNWVLRLGYAALSEPKSIAADWAYLVDHTVQIGAEKCLVIYGARLSQLRWDGPGLRHKELQMIALVPMSHSNRQRMCQELEAATKRTGVPREIVSDGGTDIKGGVEDFRQRHPETAWVYDAAHKGACLLQRRWERDPRWSAFLAQVGRTKAQVQQTELAHLAAPTVRPKSRYMNLGPVLRWSRLMLNILDRTSEIAEERERIEYKLGWLREYRPALDEWLPQYEVVQTVVRWVRQHGVYQGIEQDLRKKLDAVTSTPASEELAKEFSAFLTEQAAQARPGERLLGSTESLESCFGKWKTIERQQSKQGFTRLVLGLGAIVSDWPVPRILEALKRVPWRSVRDWCNQHLGPSVQAQRRIVYATATVNENGMNEIRCQG